MSVEDDTDLRDLVAQTLESNGCLAKIRAQLRASIFLALDEDENLNKKEPLLNKKLKSHMDTPEGKVTFCLVREFLEFFGLEYTISVFDPESYSGMCYNYEGRTKLIEHLGLQSLEVNSSQPILMQLLKPALHNKLNQNHININLNHAHLENGNEIDDFKTEEGYSSTPSTQRSNVNEESISERLEKFDNNSSADSFGGNFNATFTVNRFRVSTNGESEGSLEQDLSVKSDEKKVEIPLMELPQENQKNSDHSDQSVSTPVLKETKQEKHKFSPQKTEKLKSKNTLSSLADLPPLQMNKSRANESLILPSLYNRDFKEKNHIKEINKFLESDSLNNYEEDLLSLSDVNSSSSDNSKLSENNELSRNKENPNDSQESDDIIEDNKKNERKDDY